MIEPATSGLQSREHRVLSDNSSDVAAADDSRLTNGLTNSPENESAESSSGTFSAALAVIALLPLSDAEKADAVRRILDEHSHGSTAAWDQEATNRGEAVW